MPKNSVFVGRNTLQRQTRDRKSVYMMFLDKADFATLGSISIERSFDGNYSAYFTSSISANILSEQLRTAANNGWIYRVKALGSSKEVQGFCEPVVLCTCWNK